MGNQAAILIANAPKHIPKINNGIIIFRKLPVSVFLPASNPVRYNPIDVIVAIVNRITEIADRITTIIMLPLIDA